MANPRELFAEVGKDFVARKALQRPPQDSFLPEAESSTDSFLPEVPHQISPLESVATSGVVQTVADPLQLKRRLLETPNANALFPILGQSLGALTPLPFLGRVTGGALGGFLGKGAEKFQEAERTRKPMLDESIIPEALGEAGVGAVIGALPAPHEALAGGRRLIGALRLGKELGIPGGVEQSAERLSFLKGIQAEAKQTPIESGKLIPQRESALLTQYPDRQAKLTQNFSGALDRIRSLVSTNPVLHRELLSESQKAGTRDLATAFIPELQLAPSAEEKVLTTAQAGFRKSIFEKLTEQGVLQGLNPATATFDQIQQLKRTLGNVVGKKLSQFGASFEKAELDALEGYGAIREAELSTHPELAQEFGRHKEVMDHFRQVKGVLSNLSTLEQSMSSGFGKTAANQQAFQKLLSPESFLKTQFFSDATQLAQNQRMLIGRIARYAALVPLYTLVSLLRSELFRR